MVVTFAPVTSQCSKKKKKSKTMYLDHHSLLTVNSSPVTEAQIPGVLQSDELVSAIDLQGKSVGQAVHITDSERRSAVT